ncbi:anti-sigma factor [Amycolatopsis antarctica]|uniref:Anti-sigma factor n=1 Tax=Amycolatopsis antarctica TaxID=1854586 RepID=A0A263CXI9_9PSEU|nr:anti-sigma factor [Amycolatopsis antarctica]OZM70137.1 anti-sigma factor [Amycolatopsis antarctica]
MEVRTDATPEVVPTLRTLAADLAMRLDFDLDAVEDLRMTVDEACSLLLPAAADGTLTCEFRWASGRVEVNVTVLADQPGLAQEDSLGWQLLTALATSARRMVTPLDDGYLTRVELVRECVTVAR